MTLQERREKLHDLLLEIKRLQDELPLRGESPATTGGVSGSGIGWRVIEINPETGEPVPRARDSRVPRYANTQWTVFDDRIVCTSGAHIGYTIENHRLLDERPGRGRLYDWPVHMGEKEWVDLTAFEGALYAAIRVQEELMLLEGPVSDEGRFSEVDHLYMQYAFAEAKRARALQKLVDIEFKAKFPNRPLGLNGAELSEWAIYEAGLRASLAY